MDSLSLATWLVAGMAIVVLILCAIAAVALIYIYCRRKRTLDYQLANFNPDCEHGDNGVQQLYHHTQLIGDGSPRIEVHDQQTTELRKNKSEFKQIKRFRLFKRKLSFRKRHSEVIDFDFPPKPMPIKKRVMFANRLTRSDWDLYDMRNSVTQSEIDQLLKRERPGLSDELPVEEGKSQYFDALEYVEGEAMVGGANINQTSEFYTDALSYREDDATRDHPHHHQDDEYEDIDELEADVCENAQIKRSKKNRLRMRGGTAQPQKLHPDVKRRVNAVKKILFRQKQIEYNFYRDLHQLEGKFNFLQQDKVYQERQKLIEGTQRTVNSIPEVDEDQEETSDLLSNGSSGITDDGIPEFWLRVIINSKNLCQIVQTTDIPALCHLVNISIIYLEKPLGFRLAFTFKENEFFTDQVLTKDYELKYQPLPGENPFHFEGLEISSCRGCKIHWKKHKNLTVRPVKKVHNHKIVTRWARKNSFFNFFNPPKLDNAEDVHFLKQRELLEAHFELGLFFKEQIIPRAYQFYSVPGYDTHIQSSRVFGAMKRQQLIKSSSISLTPVRKRSHNRQEDLKGSKRSLRNAGSYQGLQVDKQAVEPATEKMNGGDCLSHDVHESVLAQQHANGFIPPDAAEPADQHGRLEDEDDIQDDLPEQSDPLLGRYLMESSEKFDEVLKVLGVGLVRRKLANSVVPTNVIERDEEGVYTIKTLTNVRNSEIRFRLNEAFIEETIDGRKTSSLAIREGNKLTLEQTGDPSKGEKNSVMIREVVGDTMFMQIIVDDVVCSRVYKRIQD